MCIDPNMPGILSRFFGVDGEPRVIEALKEQMIVLGNTEAAAELQKEGEIRYFPEGASLIREDEWSNHIIFILAGRASISIMGFKIAERTAGQHIGEMALIDPSQPRSASAIAAVPTVALVVSETKFTNAASRFPTMWRQIAKEIAHRLRQRNKFIRPSNPIPVIFIACASESLAVAKTIQAHFAGKDINAEIWTDGVFKPSIGTMESLEQKLISADFTVAIFSADDKIESRGKTQLAPRDNTIFELGLFAGAIGRERSFFAVQKDTDIKIPSDLGGITSLRFAWHKGKKTPPDTEEACAQIEARISELGPR